MMALDNLKGIWKNQTESKITFTETDIYKMIHKESTSIVKWIFYISIIEFVILSVPAFFIETSEEEKELGLALFTKAMSILNYVVILPVFIYIFYKNYKSISVQDNSTKLMSDILKTRKTVKIYVYSQLALIALFLTVFLYKFSQSDMVPEDIDSSFLLLVSIGIVLFFVFIVWLFYRIIYGVLLKELHTNYKELLNNDSH